MSLKNRVELWCKAKFERHEKSVSEERDEFHLYEPESIVWSHNLEQQRTKNQQQQQKD